MALRFREEAIVGAEVTGIGHEGDPGGLVIFLPDLGYMGVSLGKFWELYLYDLYSLCINVFSLYIRIFY